MYWKMLVAVIVAFFIGFMVANNIAVSESDTDQQVLVKLDEILSNQEEMFKSLKFIKNRAR